MATNEIRGYRLFVGVAFILILGHLMHAFFKGFSEPYAATTIAGVMTPVLVTPFALWHGYLRYGARKMIVFVVLVSIISWSYESLSIATGFPFGHYHYSSLLGTKIGTVPLSIMPAYFAFGYLAWSIAAGLLSRRDSRTVGTDVFMVPIVASFIMVAWDVTMDPINSSITGTWDWPQGGAYFGVPFVNFLGWYLCVFTFFLIFALYNRSANHGEGRPGPDQELYWQLPAFMYATIIAEYPAGMLGRESVQITTHDHHVWWTGDIYGSMTLVSLFTVLPFVVLCLHRLAVDFSKPQIGSGARATGN
ncbi:putative membrane protein [Bradyrhizobium sp. USDA 4524]|uniref:carotenoid biosynthesis protein n=1 Tax=unclassified Bradyrhizobium TaxID=2631580 RepID=UPI00209CA919|nr:MULTISPECIES: carotenoid biosynthesis protein [unclassified Bradyrhizobium]MCP1845701.1 putative membrane protein [Bradyrhizobium sp. USDA 4538]MCP1846053.1 putative membrane protein [Bradyrhizobium sp. USDA 4538]MCP1906975.1 putative membrane protein [Bradyrhizobium sp. USDA 4537]MCP1907313.1 putative membrane protein [Bradyrhizobium sp. USDA 4537]MCP1985451.1 putative membrane protein [Bradyrhizobium sp. USDA 4539]